MDVHSVGQSADYQRIRTERLQVLHELLAEVFSVGSNLARSHHTDDVLTVQGRSTPVVKQRGGIRAFTQAGRVGLVIKAYALYVSCLSKGQFLLGPLQVHIH